LKVNKFLIYLVTSKDTQNIEVNFIETNQFNATTFSQVAFVEAARKRTKTPTTFFVGRTDP
jgi:hypothetical protein